MLHIIGQLEKSRRQSHHSCVCSREKREENFWVQFPAPLLIGDEVEEKFGWLVQELLNLELNYRDIVNFKCIHSTATVFVLGIMKFFYVHSSDGRREK